MANTFITPSIVAREALMLLENNLVAAGLAHRAHTQEFLGTKVGDTITIRGPATFEAQEFTSTTTTQEIKESSTTLQLEKHFDITVGVSSREWTLELQDFSNIVIRPAVAALAQKIDTYLLGKANQLYNFTGTAGTPLNSLADVVAVDQKLNEMKVPVAGRSIIVNPAQKAALLSNVPEFVHADKRGDGGAALGNAELGEFLGLRFYMDQNIQSLTSAATGYLINSASVSVGDTSVVVDTGSGTPVVGDLFTVAGDTQQYVVTGYATNTVSFAPAAKVAWADNAAVTFVASHSMSMAGNMDGLTAAIVPLEIPSGASEADYIADRGLGIRVVYDYNSSTKTDTISFDLLCGATMQDPGLLARVLG